MTESMHFQPDKLVKAWVNWDERPGAILEADRLMIQIEKAAMVLGMSSLVLRNSVIALRRDGMSLEDAIRSVTTDA